MPRRPPLGEFEIIDLFTRALPLRGGDKALPAKEERKGRLQLILSDGSVYPERGTILFAQRQIDAATGTLQLEAEFPNPRKLIRPGQFARIRAVFDERTSAVVVPSRALMEIQGQSVLYTVNKDNKTEFGRLQLGPKFGTLRVVDQGVEAGERVIVEGIQRVRPEMIVAPVLVPADSADGVKPEEGT